MLQSRAGATRVETLHMHSERRLRGEEASVCDHAQASKCTLATHEDARRLAVESNRAAFLLAASLVHSYLKPWIDIMTIITPIVIKCIGEIIHLFSMFYMNDLRANG